MEYWVPIEQQCLLIKGKISPNSLELVKSGLPPDKPNNAEVLFIGYAFADVPAGKSFSVIFPKTNPGGGIYHESKIVAVTQQFGKPTEVIPRGWKTICLVEFPQGIPEIIKNLPVVDTWFENSDYVCICDEEAWEAIRKL
ncbi:MAG TPA: hypothetical protein VF599_22615 [Pyrinomonadaceae bacterium]|jgi:hypothetical protein